MEFTFFNIPFQFIDGRLYSSIGQDVRIVTSWTPKPYFFWSFPRSQECGISVLKANGYACLKFPCTAQLVQNKFVGSKGVSPEIKTPSFKMDAT